MPRGTRHTRYQAAIVEETRLLLIRYAPRDGEPFWLLPGGGREQESAEQCVIREVREETNLDVRVERMLLDVAAEDSSVYERWRTYLCSRVAGEASPGVEPEPEFVHLGSIVEVRWFDLQDESEWAPALLRDRITYPQMVQIRELLGLAPRPGSKPREPTGSSAGPR